MKRLFVLRERAHFDSMVAAVSLNWEACAKGGKPLGVRVAPYLKKRTDEQNALMWVWMSEIAEQAWVAGRRFDEDTWHEHMKRENLPDTCEKGVEKWRYLPSGERILQMSTTDLNTAEFSEYLTRLAAMAANDLGVTLS